MWSKINQPDEASVRHELTRCCGASAWVAGMMAARPFNSLEEVFITAGNLWWELPPTAWLEAFAHHPPIGDVATLRDRWAATADLSHKEQAAVQTADSATLHALASANATYQRTFGHIFIVCATGKSASEMLALLHGRLPNPPALELRLAAEEQRQITFLRLAQWLGQAPTLGQRVVLTALQRPDGHMAWQLRDDIPTIVWPNHWALFGGTVEEGETTAEAARREVAEELAIALDPQKLAFGRTHFSMGDLGFKGIWLYHYPITHEMAHAVLHEGQRYDWHAPAALATPHWQGHPVAPHHRALAQWLVRIADWRLGIAD